MAWIPPITHWGQQGQTSPGVTDFNRIEGNIAILGKYDRAPGYGIATGQNAKSIMLDPAPGSYYDGLCFAFKNETQNTGAVTINVNGMGAKPIKKPNGNDLVAGNLKAGSVYTVRYNGTNFILQGSDSSGNATPEHVLAGKTFSNDTDTELTGTMPNRAGDTPALASSVSGTTLKLLASRGYRDGVDDTVTITDADFLAENIKRGKSIFGLEGTYPAAFTAGDVVLYMDPVRKVVWGDTYTKVNDITIVFAGTYRVKFELAASTSLVSTPVYGRIYKNGVAVGTERSAFSETYIEFTEDLTFAAGDNIQLYTKGSTAPAAAISINFTVAANSNPLYSIVL